MNFPTINPCTCGETKVRVDISRVAVKLSCEVCGRYVASDDLDRAAETWNEKESK